MVSSLFVAVLQHAVALAPTPAAHAAALPLLARAAGALGDAPFFDRAINNARALLDQVDHTSLFNPYALHEIELRGLVATGRADTAIKLVEEPPAATISVAPQWRVIEQVTVANVLLLAGDTSGARTALECAVREALAQRLPHQLQRITRIADERLPDSRAEATHAFALLRSDLAA